MSQWKSDDPGRSVIRSYVLIGTILVFLASAFLSILQLLGEFRSDRGETRGTVLWLATEVSREYGLLMDSISRYAHGESSTSHDDVLLRLDLLWSQFDSFRSGAVGARVLSVSGAEETIQAIEALLNEVEPNLRTLRSGDVLAGVALRDQLEMQVGSLHRLVQSIDKSEQGFLYSVTVQTERSLRLLALYLVLMSLSCAVLIFLLMRETRRANSLLELATEAEDRLKETNEDLEQRVNERTQTLAEREAELREAVDNLHLAKEAGNIGTWIVELASGEVMWDATNVALHGLPKDRRIGTFADWANTVHPEDLERVSAEYQAALDGSTDFDTEYRVILANGDVRHLKGNAMIVRNDDGQAIRVVGMNYDLTPLRQKEAELLRTQRVANQAQKMEVIGQLTGGMAHDFNNLLAIIHGNLELLLDEEPSGEYANNDRIDLLTNSLAATRRGGDLTKKMLTFARQSSLEPVVLDVNSVIKETERWVARTIPSNVEIETSLQSRCWPAKLDPGSLQSAIVNIVVNARDAMPDGGKLTIETSNLRVDQSHLDDAGEDMPPGRYVMLAITDTGAGISDADLKKVFDPFFTTKEIGFGTGLGLSMVEGFVKQSSGFVRVYSELGSGTSIKMYFPALDPAIPPTAPVSREAATLKEGNKIRVLLVDDEIEILNVLRRGLMSAEYSVDVAPSGDAAMEIFRSSGPYDIVITDIVMPGKLQGPFLAKALRELCPELPVIFMSGYASEATVHGNGLRVEDIRLTKPVPRSELLKAIKQALGAN